MVKASVPRPYWEEEHVQGEHREKKMGLKSSFKLEHSSSMWALMSWIEQCLMALPPPKSPPS